MNYVSGLFYIEEEADETLASLFAGGRLVDAWVVDAEAESAAAYGQVSWTPPVLRDRLELTFGLRYTDDTREATKTFVNPGFTPAVKGLVIPGELDFDSLDPMVNVAYAFSDNINAYARFSTGYRAGGFNAQSTPAYFAPASNRFAIPLP